MKRRKKKPASYYIAWAVAYTLVLGGCAGAFLLIRAILLTMGYGLPY